MRNATAKPLGRHRIATCIGVALLMSGFAARSNAAHASAQGPAAHSNTVHTTTRGPAAARSARTLSGKDVAHLHLVHQHEAKLYEEGAARGVLRGTMHAQLTVGSVFSGSFKIDTRSGSVTGHGSARPHGAGRYQSFSGTMYVTSGSGRYAHIHGRTRLYGTFDRRTFDVVLKTSGRLSY